MQLNSKFLLFIIPYIFLLTPFESISGKYHFERSEKTELDCLESSDYLN